MAQDKRENTQGFFSAFFGVVKSTLDKAPADPHFNFPNRQVLHDKVTPMVQSVNKHLNDHNVDLAPEHIPHFERGAAIETYPTETFADRARKGWKNVKNERKIVASFAEEVARESEKGQDANPNTLVYARVGFWAHSVLGASKAAANPYVTIPEETCSDFAVGATYHRLMNEQDAKQDADPSTFGFSAKR